MDKSTFQRFLLSNETKTVKVVLAYTSGSDPELFDKDETIVISKPNKKARQHAAHFPEFEKIWKLAFEKL